MATYRVFMFIDALPDDIESGDDVRFIKDGFSIWALIFGIFWLLWHRLWLGLLIFGVLIAVFVGLSKLTNPVLGILLFDLLVLYLAFEGQSWRADKLAANGWEEVDVVIADNLEEAEFRFFLHDTITEEDEQDTFDEPAPQPLKPMLPAMHRVNKKPQIIGGIMPPPAPTRS